MSAPQENLSLQIVDFYKQLANTASELNTASDQLGASIIPLDNALRKLNLGITSWIPIVEWEDDDNSYERHDIGYARVNRTWGIALRTVEGREHPRVDKMEEWLFNDAPRAYRIEAVDKLPELFATLIQEADAATASLRQKTQIARDLSAAINGAASELQVKREAEAVERRQALDRSLKSHLESLKKTTGGTK